MPLLPVRNAVVFPGTVLPLDIGRPGTLLAVEAAIATEPAFVAIFSQQDPAVEAPASDDLHMTGCLCVVRYFRRKHDGASAWVLVEGIRRIAMVGFAQTAPYQAVRVVDVNVDVGDAVEIAALDRRLRDTARMVADAMPEIREPAIAVIEGTADIAKLADVVMANFPVSVADSASYAAETRLAQRLVRVIALLDGELAKLRVAPVPG